MGRRRCWAPEESDPCGADCLKRGVWESLGKLGAPIKIRYQNISRGPKQGGLFGTGHFERSLDQGALPSNWMWSASAGPGNGRVRPHVSRIDSGTPSTPGVSEASPRVCGSLAKPPTSTECCGVR